MSSRRLWLFTFLGFGIIYLTTAHWWGSLSVDTQAADWASWRLAHTGSLDLARVRHLPDNPFFTAAGSRVIPGRTMGVILLGLPMQLLLGASHLSPDTPGVLTAAVSAATAMANLAVVLRRLGGSRGQVIGATAVIGLGTATWTVASTELWSHTSALLWGSGMLLALASDRPWLAAASSIPLVWSRPHLAVVPAFIGLLVARERRDARVLVTFALCGGFAFGALLLWNNWVYGHPSVGGDYYGQYVGSRATAAGRGIARVWLENGLGALVSPYRGMALYSPIVLVGLAGLIAGWRTSPAWVRGAVLGGLTYQAVQFKLNGFAGGTAFFGNRLVVELILTCAPGAYIGYLRLSDGRPRWVLVTRVLAALSIAEHATGSVLAGAAANYGDPSHPWKTWLLWDDVRETGGAGLSVLTVAMVLCLGVALSPQRWRRAFSVPAPVPKE
jgi:hypothetical protein